MEEKKGKFLFRSSSGNEDAINVIRSSTYSFKAISDEDKETLRQLESRHNVKRSSDDEDEENVVKKLAKQNEGESPPPPLPSQPPPLPPSCPPPLDNDEDEESPAKGFCPRNIPSIDDEEEPSMYREGPPPLADEEIFSEEEEQKTAKDYKSCTKAFISEEVENMSRVIHDLEEKDIDKEEIIDASTVATIDDSETPSLRVQGLSDNPNAQDDDRQHDFDDEDIVEDNDSSPVKTDEDENVLDAEDNKFNDGVINGKEKVEEKIETKIEEQKQETEEELEKEPIKEKQDYESNKEKEENKQPFEETKNKEISNLDTTDSKEQNPVTIETTSEKCSQSTNNDTSPEKNGQDTLENSRNDDTHNGSLDTSSCLDSTIESSKQGDSSIDDIKITSPLLNLTAEKARASLRLPGRKKPTRASVTTNTLFNAVDINLNDSSDKTDNDVKSNGHDVEPVKKEKPKLPPGAVPIPYIPPKSKDESPPKPKATKFGVPIMPVSLSASLASAVKEKVTKVDKVEASEKIEKIEDKVPTKIETEEKTIKMPNISDNHSGSPIQAKPTPLPRKPKPVLRNVSQEEANSNVPAWQSSLKPRPVVPPKPVPRKEEQPVWMQKAREVADRKSAIITDSTDSNTNGNNQPIFKPAVKENTTEKPQWLRDLAKKRVNKPQIVEKTKTEDQEGELQKEFKLRKQRVKEKIAARRQSMQ